MLAPPPITLGDHVVDSSLLPSSKRRCKSNTTHKKKLQNALTQRVASPIFREFCPPPSPILSTLDTLTARPLAPDTALRCFVKRRVVKGDARDLDLTSPFREPDAKCNLQGRVMNAEFHSPINFIEGSSCLESPEDELAEKTFAPINLKFKLKRALDELTKSPVHVVEPGISDDFFIVGPSQALRKEILASQVDLDDEKTTITVDSIKSPAVSSPAAPKKNRVPSVLSRGLSLIIDPPTPHIPANLGEISILEPLTPSSQALFDSLKKFKCPSADIISRITASFTTTLGIKRTGFREVAHYGFEGQQCNIDYLATPDGELSLFTPLILGSGRFKEVTLAINVATCALEAIGQCQRSLCTYGFTADTCPIPSIGASDEQGFDLLLGAPHPNILPCHIIRVDGRPTGLMKMPFAEGGDLITFFKTLNFSTPRDITTALHLLLGGAQGLAHIARLGLVHGDIKGNNLLVAITADGPRCMVGDLDYTQKDTSYEKHLVTDARYMVHVSPQTSHCFVSFSHLCKSDYNWSGEDTWAFGLTILELIVDKADLHSILGKSTLEHAQLHFDTKAQDEWRLQIRNLVCKATSPWATSDEVKKSLQQAITIALEPSCSRLSIHYVVESLQSAYDLETL